MSILACEVCLHQPYFLLHQQHAILPQMQWHYVLTLILWTQCPVGPMRSVLLGKENMVSGGAR